ncbi:MAG: hypothetical protein N2112_02465 [Gemmataceae bacterium]|nr:hypothetical protein [Gemmataceae bacterium]
MANKTPKPNEMASTLAAGGTTGAALASGAIGAISIFGKALGQVKSVFIDPIISAAQNGLQTGVGKGMGLETLGRSAEYLGMVLGGMFAPQIVHVSALLLTFGERLSKFSIDIKAAGEKALDTYQRYLGWLPSSRILGLDDWRSTIKNTKSALGMGESDYLNNLRLAKDTLKMGLLGGQKAAYYDLNNVREQIQLGSQVDPMTQKFRDLITQQIERLDKNIEEQLKIQKEAIRN